MGARRKPVPRNRPGPDGGLSPPPSRQGTSPSFFRDRAVVGLMCRRVGPFALSPDPLTLCVFWERAVMAVDNNCTETVGYVTTKSLGAAAAEVLARAEQRSRRVQVGSLPGGKPSFQVQPRPPEEPMLRFFSFTHLPAHLQDVSAPFHTLAHAIVALVPRNAERTVALRDLLTSKDAAVRAVVYP